MLEKNYKIRNLPHSTYYQSLLLELYSGSEGFVINYLQFMYQYNLFFNKNRAYEEAFKYLIDNEFECISLVSEILNVLGCDTKFASNNGKFISGRQIDYVKDLMQMHLLDIENIEKNIIEIKSMMQKISVNVIKNQLRDILIIKQNELRFLKNLVIEIK